MIHTLQGLLSTLANGFAAHLDQWDGWAVLIAAALFGFRGGTWWMPVLVAAIVNPAPYGLVSAVAHSRAVSLNGAAVFTVVQLLIACAGFLVGRLVTRLR